MENQANSKMEKLSRQEYNRLYYKKNRERLLDKKKPLPRANVLQLFVRNKLKCPTSPREWHSSDYFSFIEILLLISLTTIMTFFLIRESAAFYLDAQEGHVQAYLKAGMIEGVAILFSFSRSGHPVLKWAQRVILVLLCSFTLCVMSGKVVKASVQDTSQIQALQQIIQDLEVQKNQKEILRQGFVDRRWLNKARQYEKGIDQVREKLTQARHEMAAMPTPKIVMSSLSLLIAFRILMLVANLICFHRLAEYFSPTKQDEMASISGLNG